MQDHASQILFAKHVQVECTVGSVVRDTQSRVDPASTHMLLLTSFFSHASIHMLYSHASTHIYMLLLTCFFSNASIHMLLLTCFYSQASTHMLTLAQVTQLLLTLAISPKDLEPMVVGEIPSPEGGTLGPEKHRNLTLPLVV